MRYALATFLTLHGLAHLVGFLTPCRLMSPEPGARHAINVLFGGRLELGDATTRLLRFAWLATALAFVLVAVGIWQQATWSLGMLILVSVLSLGLTLVWWSSARIGAAINGALLIGLLSVGLVEFRADMTDARGRTSGSSLLTTSFGPIEYATLGTGTPVLAIHGTAGGWDQGLSAASGIIPFGYRVIAPSRFGYLRTPWRDDATPALEADVFAAMLDSLGIARVVVMSWSAGSSPALQFALRHPDRVSKMVSFVPGAGGIVEASGGPPTWLIAALFKWNFPIWAAQRIAPGTMLKFVAVPASLLPTLAPHDRAALDDVIMGVFPVSARHDGMVYDARNQSGATGNYPLERITTPTLFISAEDDLYRTMRAARHAAGIVPGAQLIAYETGGHLLLGRGSEMWPRIAAFLSELP
jgi:2-hydroxy-6-oxonona-2,4-dienedioate hydrolase